MFNTVQQTPFLCSFQEEEKRLETRSSRGVKKDSGEDSPGMSGDSESGEGEGGSGGEDEGREGCELEEEEEKEEEGGEGGGDGEMDECEDEELEAEDSEEEREDVLKVSAECRHARYELIRSLLLRWSVFQQSYQPPNSLSRGVYF